MNLVSDPVHPGVIDKQLTHFTYNDVSKSRFNSHLVDSKVFLFQLFLVCVVSPFESNEVSSCVSLFYWKVSNNCNGL